jgi:hypothetical protein
MREDGGSTKADKRGERPDFLFDLIMRQASRYFLSHQTLLVSRRLPLGERARHEKMDEWMHLGIEPGFLNCPFDILKTLVAKTPK